MVISTGRWWRSRTLRAALAVWTYLAIVRAAPASAEFSPAHRDNSHTAWTLDRREWRLGLSHVEFGALDRVDVGTYTWPWTLGAGSFLFHWEAIRFHGWTGSLRLSPVWLFRVRTRQANVEARASMVIAPIEVLATRQASETFAWSIGAIYSRTLVLGSTSDVDARGAAGVQSLQFLASGERVILPWLSVQLHYRYVFFQRGASNATYESAPDPYTKVEAVAVGSSAIVDLQGAWSLIPAVGFSDRMFNATVGVGFGNFIVPGTQFVLSPRTITGMLELFLRWGGEARSRSDAPAPDSPRRRTT